MKRFTAIAAALAMALASGVSQPAGFERRPAEDFVPKPAPGFVPQPSPDFVPDPSRSTHPPRAPHGVAGGHPWVRNPLWRRPVRTGVPHPRYRFRGQPFVVISGPVFAAPWLYYPYAVGSPWGASYYIPGEPGYFLYYCADPAGYYPDVQDCPGGWYQSVPDESQDIGSGN
jgi:hypothetical protein